MGVRSEVVRLSLQDAGFTAEMAKAYGATALLARALDQVDGKVIRVSGTSKTAARDIESLGGAFRKSGPDIDKFSGRLGLAARAVAAFGPAAVPIATSLAPALAGLATQMGAAALAGGVLVASFQGVGDALEAVNEYRLAPTRANLLKVREQMAGLSEEARRAVRAMADLRPVLLGIRDAGATGFFPGFTEGLKDFETLAPALERIFNAVGGSAGGLFEGALDELSSDEWEPFLAFVEAEAPAALEKLGRTVGNLTKGLAELWMVTDPVSDDFMDGLLNASESFESWAEGVKETEGYREFIDYVRETGPQVLETVGSLANAVLQIGEAAAPLGGPVLQIVETFADTVAIIADSPLGPPLMAAATAMSALSLATKGFNLVSATTFGAKAGGLRSGVRSFASDLSLLAAAQLTNVKMGERQIAAQKNVRAGMVKAGAGAAALGAGYAGMQAGLIGSNTAMGAAVGMMAGPWGAAAGATIGLAADMAAANDSAAEAIDRFNDSIRRGSDISTIEANYQAAADAVDEFRLKMTQGTDEFDFWGKTKNSIEGAFGLSDLEEVEKDGAAAARDFAKAQESAAQAMGYTSRAAQVTADAMRALTEDTIAAFDAGLAFEQAQVSLAEAVRKNGRVVDENGNALKGHRQAAIDSESQLSNLAKRFIDLNDRAGSTPAQLAAAKAEIAKAAEAMGYGSVQAKKLADGMLNIKSKSVTVKVNGIDVARSDLAGLQTAINNVKGKVVEIGTRVTGGFGGLLGFNDGGTIPGPRYPYGDKVLIRAAPGEEVITNRNGEADRFRADRAAGRIPAYADGGTIQALASGGRVRGDDSDGVRSLGREAGRSAKEIRKEREQRRKARLEAVSRRLEAAKSKHTDLASSVASRFQSDLWEAPGNPWAATASADPIARLAADNAKLQQFEAARAALASKGLDGNAAADLFAGADLATVQGFAQSWTPTQITQFEQQYAMREQLSAAVGGRAGDTAYAAEIATLTKEVQGLRRDVRKGAKDTGREVGDKVNGAASKGRRRRR